MPMPKPGLLLVDDDPLIRETLGLVFSNEFDVRSAASRPEAVSLISQPGFLPALALVDLGLPPDTHHADEGFRLIVELKALRPDLQILALSGQTGEQQARHARTLGAIDFIAKPAEPGKIRALLFQALNWRSADAVIAPQVFVDGLLGCSASMEKLRRQVYQFASAPFPVLICGESGSGKEAVAQALHAASPRANAPCLALNCAALSESLIEATLFGHAKGAFTGAQTAKAGYFEEAGEGTLFLDEIGDLPLGLQAKLLRVLENGDFQRLGETQGRHSHARIVAATNRDLRSLARSGAFRSDLYHRLSVLNIETPALRELGEDRLLLLKHFLTRYADQLHCAPFRLDDAASRDWLRYSFPGNVRELRNITIRLLAKYPGQQVSSAELREELDMDFAEPGNTANVSGIQQKLANSRDFKLDQWLAEQEQAFIQAALQLANGSMSQAAKLLGLNRTTLYSRLSGQTQRDGKADVP
ncbi:sigma-54-dependent transcriptional regulator [Chitinimonas sp. PSY-7]